MNYLELAYQGLKHGERVAELAREVEALKRAGVCVNQKLEDLTQKKQTEAEFTQPLEPPTDTELIDWLEKEKGHVMYDAELCTYKVRFRVGQGEFVSDCGTIRGAIRAAIFGVVRRRGING